MQLYLKNVKRISTFRTKALASSEYAPPLQLNDLVHCPPPPPRTNTRPIGEAPYGVPLETGGEIQDSKVSLVHVSLQFSKTEPIAVPPERTV